MVDFTEALAYAAEFNPFNTQMTHASFKRNIIYVSQL